MQKASLTLNKQQQQEFAQEVNDRLDRITMSWDNLLREWHPIAIRALDFANVRVLQIEQSKFAGLFKTESTGVNMNVVTFLCNNLEDRCAHELGMTAEQFAGVLVMNAEVGKAWRAFHDPVYKEVYKKFELKCGIGLTKIIDN